MQKQDKTSSPQSFPPPCDMRVFLYYCDHIAQVLVHWACTKISACLDQPDEKLRDEIVQRVGGCATVRYATIAAHAQSTGRNGLAALLLEHETCAGEQVQY